jgi:hydrogenase nickel incorporation protein HypB
MSTRLLEVRKGVLSRNDRDAAALRAQFAASGLYVVNLVSSPGAGKTALLEATLRALLQRGWRAAALVGDLETDNDALRLARAGAPVRQIKTGGNCHLEAETIGHFLQGWNLDELDFLFIENVGNLVCPANYDLGETLRAVLLSTTEGEDKPLKYPPIFYSADVALITKIDLAEAVEFDRAAAYTNLARVHPGMPVLECSARRAEGMEAWLDFLEGHAAPRKTPRSEERAEEGT